MICHAPNFLPRLFLLLTLPTFAGLFAVQSNAEEATPLTINLLSDDLGDPQSPGNFTLSISLPPAVRRSIPTLTPAHFAVHVFPAGLKYDDGLTASYRASGVMVWAYGDRVFLDVRQPPTQKETGEYIVHVGLLNDGTILAQGQATKKVRYSPSQVDVVLVIDSSKSMRRSDPRRKRIAAARSFLEMAARDGRIAHAGIVSFNSYAEILAPLTPIAQRETLLRTLKKMPIEGMTNMDGALELAETVLAKSAASRKVVVFLTDGRNEPHRYGGRHKKLAAQGIPIYAIGLSPRADHALLKTMAKDTGGKAYSATSGHDLIAIYQQVAADIGRRVMLLKTKVGGGATTLDVPIDRSVAAVSFALRLADGAGTLVLTSPQGNRLREAAAQFTTTPDGRRKLVRIAKPRAGTWSLAMQTPQNDKAHTLTATAETNFFLELFPPQLRGQQLTLAVTLAEGTRIFTGAEIKHLGSGADGVPPFTLFDDGQHADGAAGDGVYGARVTLADDLAGGLSLRLRAQGTREGDDAFVRQIDLDLTAIKAASPRPIVTVKKIERLLLRPFFLGTGLPGDERVGRGELMLIADAPRLLTVRAGSLKSAEGNIIPAKQIQFSIPPEQLLQPGKTPLAVTLSLPTTIPTGHYHGWVHLTAGRAEKQCSVEVIVVAAHLQATPRILDFGTVLPGQRVIRSVRLTLTAPRALPLQILSAAGEGKYLTMKRVAKANLTPEQAESVDFILTLPHDETPGIKRGRVTLAASIARTTLDIRYTIPAPAPPPPAKIEPEPILTHMPPQPTPPPPEPKKSPPEKTTPSPPPQVEPTEATATSAAVWEAMRPYLLWGIFLFVLLLILVLIMGRAIIKHRMARFAMLSALLHLIAILLVAYFVVFDNTAIETIKKPRLIAKLVSIKQDLGLQLSPAEQKLLQQVKAIAARERDLALKPTAAAIVPVKHQAKKEEAKALAAPASFSHAVERVALPIPKPKELTRTQPVRRLASPTPELPREKTAPGRVTISSPKPPRPRDMMPEVSVKAPLPKTETTQKPEPPKTPKPITNTLSRQPQQRVSLTRITRLQRRAPAPLINSPAQKKKKKMPMRQPLPTHPTPLISASSPAPRAVPAKRLPSAPADRERVLNSPSYTDTVSVVRTAPAAPPAIAKPLNFSRRSSRLEPLRSHPRPARMTPRHASARRASNFQPEPKTANHRSAKTPTTRPAPAAQTTRPPAERTTLNAVGQPSGKPPRVSAASRSLGSTHSAPLKSRTHSPIRMTQMKTDDRAAPSPTPLNKRSALPTRRDSITPQAKQTATAPTTTRSEKLPPASPPQVAASSERKILVERRTQATILRVASPTAKTAIQPIDLGKSATRLAKQSPLPQRRLATLRPTQRAPTTPVSPRAPAPLTEQSPTAPAAATASPAHDPQTHFSSTGQPAAASTDIPRGAVATASPPLNASQHPPVRLTGVPSAERQSPAKLPASQTPISAMAAPLGPTSAATRTPNRPGINPSQQQSGEQNDRQQFSLIGKTSTREQMLAGHRPAPRTIRPTPRLFGRTRLADLRTPVKITRAAVPRKQPVKRRAQTLTTSAQAGALSIVLGEVKFGSDWNSSPLALANLAAAYQKRVTAGSTGMRVEKKTVRLTTRALADCHLIFMTGNLSFSFTAKEVQALRRYLAAGGTLWVNDSSREGDETFDRAVRREIKKVMGSELKKLPRQHDLMHTAYDFRRGYLGYQIPPGDKYRLDYLEGITLKNRLAVLYTRNDYADGMALDPQLYALRTSTTNLSPEEMLEGSLRFGINVVQYALGGRGQAALTVNAVTQTPKRANVFRGDPSRLRVWQDFTNQTSTTHGWQAETWGNPAVISFVASGKQKAGAAMQITITKGKNHKSAIKFDIPTTAGRRLDLSKVKSLVLDVKNEHHGGFRVALVLTTVDRNNQWRDFESKSIYLHPGWNRRLRFAIAGERFKSRETEWKAYDTKLRGAARCGKVGLFFYNGNRISTRVTVDNLTFEY